MVSSTGSRPSSATRTVTCVLVALTMSSVPVGVGGAGVPGGAGASSQANTAGPVMLAL